MKSSIYSDSLCQWKRVEQFCRQCAIFTFFNNWFDRSTRNLESKEVVKWHQKLCIKYLVMQLMVEN